MASRKLLSLVPIVLISVACEPASEPFGRATEHLVGGAADQGDPAVVYLLASKAGGSGAAVCTGTIVSPHVIATAGHCVDPAELEPILGAGYTWKVFLGDNHDDQGQLDDPALFVAVDEVRFDPALSLVGRPTHDVGAVITTEPLDVTPVPVSHVALDDTSVGTPLRIVGYGRTKANDPKTIGQKHQADGTLAEYSDEWLSFEGVPGFCDGDSGGPTFVTRNGIESLAGVHSYGDSASCNGKSFDMRADVDLVAFLDPLIAEKDPGFQPPDDGSGVGEGGAGGGGSDEKPRSDDMDDGGCSVGPGDGVSGVQWLCVTSMAALASSRRRRSRRATSR